MMEAWTENDETAYALAKRGFDELNARRERVRRAQANALDDVSERVKDGLSRILDSGSRTTLADIDNEELSQALRQNAYLLRVALEPYATPPVVPQEVVREHAD